MKSFAKTLAILVFAVTVGSSAAMRVAKTLFPEPSQIADAPSWVVIDSYPNNSTTPTNYPSMGKNYTVVVQKGGLRATAKCDSPFTNGTRVHVQTVIFRWEPLSVGSTMRIAYPAPPVH